MKNLAAASLIFVMLLGGWLIFLAHADKRTESLINTISHEVLPPIEDEHWNESLVKINSFSRDWHSFRRFCFYFLDSGVLCDIDESLAKSIKYVEAKDVSNSTGELYAIISQLQYLTENQKVTFANIF